MSAGDGKRNRIAPLPMQVKRRSFAFNDEMEIGEGCWRSIDNLKQTPGRGVCARVKRKSLSTLPLHHLLTYFNIFSLLPSNTESFHLESKIFTEAKTTKISSTQASGAPLCVFYDDCALNRVHFRRISGSIVLGRSVFIGEKWKTAFVSCIFFFLRSRRQKKNFPTFNFLFHPLRKIKRNWNFTLRRLICKRKSRRNRENLLRLRMQGWK